MVSSSAYEGEGENAAEEGRVARQQLALIDDDAHSPPSSFDWKFVPRPKATKVELTLKAVDDFSSCLCLQVNKKVNDPTLLAHFGGRDMELGQPQYVPRFHIPDPDAQGATLIDKIECALSKTRDQIEVEVISRQVLHICPNINQKDSKALLQLLADNSVLAVPADKNLGLCLVTTEWYHNMGLKLLVNDSYVEAKPDHVVLLLML
ncbi:hypothetical protein B0H10DRAFT_1952856 [Mycena sp. CBHHK59/15]|nr:hypothetical protein B0H10DRAFT_1952856 [Mycena sp. CBHHK59/15]